MSGIINLTGEVRHYHTDDKTGLMIPGTFYKGPNTINSALGYYLMYKLGTHTLDYAIDNFFTEGAAVNGDDVGFDGIAQADDLPGSETIDYVFLTSLNTGGDESVAYAEFYGSIPGAVTLATYLQLGWNLKGSDPYDFTKVFAYYAINETVAAGRTFHFYWKITAA